MPLTAGQLVVDLEPIPVRIREVDADRDGMVRDADGHLFGLQPLIHFREVFEAPHSPRHVVQAHLLLLRSRGVFAHLVPGKVMVSCVWRPKTSVYHLCERSALRTKMLTWSRETGL